MSRIGGRTAGGETHWRGLTINPTHGVGSMAATEPIPVIPTVEMLRQAGARFQDHAEAIVNSARLDVAKDLRLAGRIAGAYASLRVRVAEEGGEILKGERRLDAAKRLLADSGYAVQPIACISSLHDPRRPGAIPAPMIFCAGK